MPAHITQVGTSCQTGFRNFQIEVMGHCAQGTIYAGQDFVQRGAVADILVRFNAIS
jgi:hypothetical protein